MPHSLHSIRKTAIGLLTIAVFSCVLSSAQAAWTQRAGNWFTADTFTFYSTNHFIDANGRRIHQPRFAKQEWNNYVEYGWRDDVTLGANLFLQRLESDFLQYTPSGNSYLSGTKYNYGLADSEFFLRKRLWQGTLAKKGAVFSVQPLVKLPSFYYSGDDPRGGTDNFDAELRLQGGYNFSLLQQDHFATLNLGYRKRFGEWHDQIKADSTVGFTLNRHFSLLLQAFLTRRMEDNARAVISNATVNDYDLVKTQASLVYNLNRRTRIQIGSFHHLYARNTGDGQGFLLSLWREF